MSRQPVKGKIFRVSDISKSAVKNRKEIYVKGDDCGFKVGDEYMSFRPGYTTGIYSYSAQGKTQFLIEQMVNLSRVHKRKHAIWLTENGKKEELVIDIAMTVVGKSLFSDDPELMMTEEELESALLWMDEFFFIIDHEEEILNIVDIITLTKSFEKEHEIKIDCLSIDNASNLGKPPECVRMQTAEYMAYLMTAINRSALKYTWHIFMLFHVTIQDPIECKVSGKKYMPCPNHYMISGGQQINFKGFQLIAVWRPISRQDQYGIIDPETELPYELNETRILVTKTKPKAVGMQGMFPLFFDKNRQRFYEEYNDERYYSNDYFNQEGINPVSKALPKITEVQPDTKDLFQPVLKAQPNVDPAAGITPSSDWEF